MQLYESIGCKRGVKTVSTQPFVFGEHPRAWTSETRTLLGRGGEKEEVLKWGGIVITLILTLKYSKYLEFSVLRKPDMYSTHLPPQRELEAFSLYWPVPHHSIWTPVETSTFHVGGASRIC